jgi:hypothetical protein
MSTNDGLTALREAVSGSSSQVAASDWGLLFAAVQDRLRIIVGEPVDASGALPAQQRPLARVKVEVLECVAALDTLAASFAHELQRCRQLELEVAAAQSALAQARAERVGPRDEEQRHLAYHDGDRAEGRLTAVPADPLGAGAVAPEAPPPRAKTGSGAA